MERLNRDVVIAVFLLLVCGVMFWASFDIREPDYGQLPPSTWPRVILVALAILSLIYLVQSLRHGPAANADELARAEATRSEGEAVQEDGPGGVIGWLSYWRNPLICYGLFFLYLVTLPILGSLLGGLAFVFTLMGALGGWAPRKLAVHAVIALATVGGMWSLFTYGLGVILPPGVIFSPF